MVPLAAINGKYDLCVQNRGGNVDDVAMRGTIINPAGLRLAPGVQVTVVGESRSSYIRGE